MGEHLGRMMQQSGRDGTKRIGPAADLSQMKYGNRRVVVANSYERVRELFVKNINQTSDRPTSYVFEHFVGNTST